MYEVLSPRVVGHKPGDRIDLPADVARRKVRAGLIRKVLKTGGPVSASESTLVGEPVPEFVVSKPPSAKKAAAKKGDN